MKFPMFKTYRKAAQDESTEICEEKGLLVENDAVSRRKKTSCIASWNQSSLLIVNLILLFVNLLGWGVSFKRSWPGTPEMAFVIPPLQDVVHYEVVKTDVGLGRESKYVEDTREADALWEEISFDGPDGWIVVSEDDLKQINQTSVPLADGTGYIVGIEAFHELHCLNYFRRRIQGRPIPLDQDPMPDSHVAHCLDIVRLSIECHADLSLMPLKWIEDWPLPWPVFQTTRQCRNWDGIVEWTQQNSIDVSGRLVHPRLGPATGKGIDRSAAPEIASIRYIPEEEW